jgi:hypothetical protein
MIQQYFRPGSKDCWFIVEAGQTPVGFIEPTAQLCGRI